MVRLRVKKYFIVLTLVGSFVSTALVSFPQAGAVTGSQWQPGYIIDDSVFFNRSAMSAQEVQTFLSAKVPVCDTNGTSGPYNGYSTRAQWAAATGNPQPPYTCLKDYTQYVTPTSSDSYCSQGISEGTKSAAMIIAEVGWACNINPQVLIVLLQKEQSLITDDWPWPRQYQFATGFCVYDTGPPPPSCEGTDGFFRQVYYAARQFQRYVKQPQSFNYRAGVTSNILWNVATTGCGGANVYLQNGATAALYNYTPYQPNQAALNNLYGSGDGCSAYGNRNFWRMFNDWFGPTVGRLVKAPNDNTVYLLGDTAAYPIYDVNVLNDLYPLGPVRQTAASEINTYTRGATANRLFKSTGGTIYLINAGIKVPFLDCNMVADYGYNCGNALSLADGQLNKFVTGPPVTHLLKGVNTPTVYYVERGQKRPIPTWGDVQAFRIPYLNWLTDAFVNQIPSSSAVAYGPGSLVKTEGSSSVYVVKDSENIIPLANFLYSQELGLGTSVRTIVSYYTVLGTDLRTRVECGGGNYIGTNGLNYLIPNGTIMTAYGFNSSMFVDGDTACYNLSITSQPLDRFIRSNNGSIFYVSEGQKQYITTYAVYQARGGNPGNTIQVSNYFLNFLADGAPLSS